MWAMRTYEGSVVAANSLLVALGCSANFGYDGIACHADLLVAVCKAQREEAEKRLIEELSQTLGACLRMERQRVINSVIQTRANLRPAQSYSTEARQCCMRGQGAG